MLAFVIYNSILFNDYPFLFVQNSFGLTFYHFIMAQFLATLLKILHHLTTLTLVPVLSHLQDSILNFQLLKGLNNLEDLFTQLALITSLLHKILQYPFLLHHSINRYLLLIKFLLRFDLFLHLHQQLLQFLLIHLPADLP